jgi:hypothetical protein
MLNFLPDSSLLGANRSEYLEAQITQKFSLHELPPIIFHPEKLSASLHTKYLNSKALLEPHLDS